MGLHIQAGVTITTEPEYSLSYSKKGEVTHYGIYSGGSSNQRLRVYHDDLKVVYA